MSERFTVVASVGTYHHAFDRLAGWLDGWFDPARDVLIFQHGATRPIDGAINHDMVAAPDLLQLYRQADVIVLQGGAGGLMDARTAGRIPIVVPRIPVDNEVVDDHQVRLARRLATMGLIHLAETADELQGLLEAARSGDLPTHVSVIGAPEGPSQALSRLDSIELSQPLRPGGPARRTLKHLSEQPLALVSRRSLAALLGAIIAVGLSGVAAVNALVATVTAALLTGAVLLNVAAAERARSYWPTGVLLGVGGGLLGLLMSAQLFSATTLRSWAMAFLGGVLATFAVTLVHRWRLRHAGVIVVGAERDVDQVVLRWDDSLVQVRDTVVWSDDLDDRVPSAVVARTVELVARHRALRVVFAPSCDLDDPAVRSLAVYLEQRSVECVSLSDDTSLFAAMRPVQVGRNEAIEFRLLKAGGPLRSGSVRRSA